MCAIVLGPCSIDPHALAVGVNNDQLFGSVGLTRGFWGLFLAQNGSVTAMAKAPVKKAAVKKAVKKVVPQGPRKTIRCAGASPHRVQDGRITTSQLPFFIS